MIEVSFQAAQHARDSSFKSRGPSVVSKRSSLRVSFHCEEEQKVSVCNDSNFYSKKRASSLPLDEEEAKVQQEPSDVKRDEVPDEGLFDLPIATIRPESDFLMKRYSTTSSLSTQTMNLKHITSMNVLKHLKNPFTPVLFSSRVNDFTPATKLESRDYENFSLLGKYKI